MYPFYGMCLYACIIHTSAGTNTPSDTYDSYREYKCVFANTFFSQGILILLDSVPYILFHTLTMLTNFINLIETNYLVLKLIIIQFLSTSALKNYFVNI